MSGKGAILLSFVGNPRRRLRKPTDYVGFVLEGAYPALRLIPSRSISCGGIPESLSLDWLYYLSNPHRIDFGFVANFSIRFRP